MSDARSKQLILLLDGTWNDADEGPAVTNIVRLRELINRSLTDAPVSTGAKGHMSSRRLAYEKDERQRLVFYQRGVGTDGFRDSFLGGAFGEGVDGNVRRAYKFLARRYERDDEIFIFGFSRGAFTARSLVGLINCSGLLQAEYCSTEKEQKVWDLYRTSPNDRHSADFAALRPYSHDPRSFEIACVGVFDTVGALGIPSDLWWRHKRLRYGFHDVELGSAVKLCLQALAIDEHRKEFPATYWRKPRFKALRGLTVEQVWFPGAHCDVGGGYIDEAKRKKRDETVASLDDLSLDWMVRRVKAAFPDFPVDLEQLDARSGADLRACALAERHESRGWVYLLLSDYFNRTIAGYCGATRLPRRPLSCRREEFFPTERYAVPLAEMVHVSALERYGQRVAVHHGWRTREEIYRPPNLTVVLPHVGAAYGVADAPKNADPVVYVVDWDGKKIPARDPERRIAALFEGDSLRAQDYRAACKALRQGGDADLTDAFNAQAAAAE